MLGNRDIAESRTIVRALGGALAGLGVAVTIVAIGVIRALWIAGGAAAIAPITGSVLGDVMSLVPASIAAGAVIGLLWPARRNTVGAYLLGYLAAGIMFGLMVWSAMASDGRVAIREYAIVTGAATLICGTVFGGVFRRVGSTRRV